MKSLNVSMPLGGVEREVLNSSLLIISIKVAAEGKRNHCSVKASCCWEWEADVVGCREREGCRRSQADRQSCTHRAWRISLAALVLGQG